MMPDATGLTVLPHGIEFLLLLLADGGYCWAAASWQPDHEVPARAASCCVLGPIKALAVAVAALAPPAPQGRQEPVAGQRPF